MSEYVYMYKIILPGIQDLCENISYSNKQCRPRSDRPGSTLFVISLRKHAYSNILKFYMYHQKLKIFR